MRRLAPALVLGLAALAACAGPPPADAPYGPDPYDPDPVGVGFGGLTADQLAALRGLGLPILVPGDVGTFALDRFDANTDGTFGSYALGYRRSDGSCFEVSGSNEGLGGPEWPLVSTGVEIDALGRTTRVYQAADDPAATSAQIWGLDTIVSDYIDLDGTGVLFLSDTQGGCRPLSLAEAAALVADLRLLPDGPAAPPAGGGVPPSDPSALGPFAPADDLLADYNAASTPEVAADAIARRYEDDADAVQVEVLAETSYEATVLVTALGLRDDSVRDERLRLTYAPYGPTWELVAAGRQTRCQPGRGHEDWSDTYCQ